jgi:hypothetical protein
MTKHISVRLAWHMDGWNGHICNNPTANVYCVGQHSYPGDMIAQRRELAWESKVKGKSVAKLDKVPPCVYSINAFGSETVKAFSQPPDWFRDGSKVRYWDVPPFTVCTWPYEEMYTDDVKNPDGTYNYEKRLERAKRYFQELTPDKSLIFYYANYSNPFSENEANKYVLVGISRLKSLGDFLFYEGMSEENKKKYAGGFVWQMSITSHYPEQGFRLPYHRYLDKQDKLERFLFIPDNERNFKYATRHISDDDALDIVEKLIETTRALIEIGDNTENWEVRQKWLQSLIAELWQNRGAYPGLPKVLDYLGFQEAIPYYKNQVSSGKEKEAKDAIFSLLDSKTDKIPNLLLTDETRKKIQRQWKLKTEQERALLRDIFPRIDLSKEQIEKILAEDRAKNGIQAGLKQIYENPYLISEQFIGDDPDDRISFNKIDHAIIPSPELGLAPLLEKDDARRFRALCVERLRREGVHSFVSAENVLHDVNHKLSFFPDWKRQQFNLKYFEVDRNILEEALTLRTEDGRLYIYLKDVYEDEREIETQIRSLAKRPDITFKSPVTEKHWHDYLYEPNSVLAKNNPKEYEAAINGQIKVCQKVFSKPFCVISGAAGTGKTTIIKAIINAIEKAHGPGTSFQLLAPTGKAADRIREKTGKPASTIHSFLAQRGWLNDNLTFKRAGGKREEGISTYIIDEASMVDLSLGAALFRSINWASVQRLILVGDSNQLPPIGRGKVFADIIDWLNDQGSESIGILRTNLRQMENRLAGKGTGILDLANIYLREKTVDTDKPNQKSNAESILARLQEGGEIDKDLRVLYWKNQEELKQKLLNAIIRDIEADTGEKFNYDRPFELLEKAERGNKQYRRPHYFIVLSPYRGEEFGTENINLELQQFFNGYNVKNKGTLGGITIFDKIIQFRNRPKSDRYWAYNHESQRKEQIEVYNGELGYTKPHAYDSGGQKKGFRIQRFQAWFARKEKYWIEFNSESDVENNIELAYAISVHKSQGSEFDRVYFILPKSKAVLLSTELIYTGITRAQKHLTILAEEDVSVFVSLRRPEKSHLLAINSSLFTFRPVPDEMLQIRSWYEEGKIHHTLANYMVRSKSEVIIANILFDRNIPFKYEVPLFAPDGTFYIPDFTITWNGKQWYWEHLGLLDREDYRNHWQTKKEWYEKHFPGRLITTTESPTLSKDAKDIVDKYFS